MAPILFVEGLKIRYRSAKERLPRLSSSSQPSSQVVFQYPLIQVEKGECLGIVGQTGCGKTTLLNALFQPRFPGEVSYRRAEILGRDRNSIPAHELYSRISYLPQYAQNAFNPSLTAGNHFRHVQRSLQIVEENIWHAWMEELKLSPQVLEYFPYQLSGGMKQRLALLLGFLKRPALYILDEPSSGVDAVTMKIILDFLRRRKEEGVTFLMVSHDLGLVSNFSDRALILEEQLCAKQNPC
jgi:ABC-type glutathione transport system ATPase component